MRNSIFHEKIWNFDWNFNFQFGKIVADFLWNFEVWAVQRYANLVDLEKCWKMRLYAPVGGKKRPAYFVPQKKSFVTRATAGSLPELVSTHAFWSSAQKPSVLVKCLEVPKNPASNSPRADRGRSAPGGGGWGGGGENFAMESPWNRDSNIDGLSIPARRHFWGVPRIFVSLSTFS